MIIILNNEENTIVKEESHNPPNQHHVSSLAYHQELTSQQGGQIVPHLEFSSGSRARIRFTYCFTSVFSVKSNYQAAVHAIRCLEGFFPFICTLPDATRADSWG